jgi:hypothetical protein
MPKGPARRMVCATFAAAISDFDGTQPVLRQSPPILPASISTVRAPSCTAPAATDSPPEPAPITQMSASSVRIKAPGNRAGHSPAARQCRCRRVHATIWPSYRFDSALALPAWLPPRSA